MSDVMAVLTGFNTETTILNTLFCVILITAVVSNSLVLLVFYRRPGLRTVSNRFVINLLVTNLVTCFVLLPLLLFDDIWRKGSASADLAAACNYPTVCAAKEGIAIALCSSCVLSVLLIGVDQYFAVTDPLRYHSSINASTSAKMIIASWTVSCCFGVLGSLSVNERSPWYVCERLRGDFSFSPPIYQNVFPIAFTLLVFVVPFAAICRIYVSICWAARKNTRRTERNGCTVKDVRTPVVLPRRYTVVTIVGEAAENVSNVAESQRQFAAAVDASPISSHRPSTTNNLKCSSSANADSLRTRISAKSIFRKGERTRAARVSILVIVMTLICWLPFTLMMLVHLPLLAHLTLPHYVKKMGILALSLNTVVSSLIFVHRNRRIHRELCKLFKVSEKRASYYNSNGARFAKRNTYRELEQRSVRVSTVTTNDEVLVSLTSEGGVKVTSPVKSASVLNRVWNLAKNADRLQRNATLGLSQVSLEPESYRSSFSSNVSSGSNRRSTSVASISDAVDDV